jgi:hypothetical protein
MFSDFNINKYKHINYPSDFSLKTLNEIKSLQTQKLDTSFANRYDDIDKAFKQLFKNKTRTYPAALVNELIEQSHPVILRIKNYHDRPRPNELAKKFDIDLSYHKMKSAQTPAFPSGHSAQSKLISLVLSDMFPEMSNEFERVADNISKSRIVARVHYKSDKDVGEKLGKDLYNHLKTA